jgi:ribulose-phosphate 3-epimerase
MKLAPSILSADFSRLGEEVAAIQRGGAHYIHVDVMDGHFVPNISYGPTVMKSLLGKTTVPFDVHLMIENPSFFFQDFATPNTEFITIHEEACSHLHRNIQEIHDLGIKAGVSLNPATSLATLDYILEEVDLVLIMSVNPGFGGQKFIPSALEKIRALREIREENNLNFQIQVDGGITLENAGIVLQAGADILVAGSAIFSGGQAEQRTRQFLQPTL